MAHALSSFMQGEEWLTSSQLKKGRIRASHFVQERFLHTAQQKIIPWIIPSGHLVYFEEEIIFLPDTQIKTF
jgi:hypothetical protein